MPATINPSSDVLQQAAEWYAELRDGQASEQTQVQWRQWLDADEAHRAAWRAVEIISRQFQPLQGTADPRITAGNLTKANTRLRQRRQILTGMATLAGGSLLTWLGWRYTPMQGAVLALGADHATAVGARQDILLADGSRVWLNTASAIDLHFSPVMRRIRLLAGEIFIDTAADSTRPFVVDTAQGRLQALGTRFNVAHGDNEVRLDVYQGAVAVGDAAALQPAPSQIVTAGKQARISDGRILGVAQADNAREAWTRGELLADNITLGEVVTQLRRYRHGYIGVADEIAGLQVYGNFPLHDTDQVLTMLTQVLPVKVSHTLPWWVSIEADRGQNS